MATPTFQACVRQLAPLAVAVLATLAAATAWAQQPATPGCSGISSSDAGGDQRSRYFIGSGEPLDLTGAFFRTDRGSDGRLLTSANLQVAQVAAEAPAGAQAVIWTMHWRDGEIERYVSATIRDAGEPSFVHGRLESGIYVADGATTGRLVTGAGGVAQIVLPEAVSRPGARLSKPYASSHVVSDVAGAGVTEESDFSPDDRRTGGKDYVVAECTGGGEAPAPEPGQPVPGSDTPSLEYSPPVLTLMTDRAKARFVASKGRILLRLRSTGPVRKLAGSMKRGRKAVGKGRLKAMGEKGTLVVKFTRRKLARGTYTVHMRGLDSEGETVRSRGKLRLR